MPRNIRSTDIDPVFKDGFSVGWHFVLPAAYKPELDIRLTERVEDGKTVLRWTQGPFYCFTEGQVIYDTRKAYQVWSEALGHIGRYCKIINAAACSIGPENEFLSGQVFFRIRQPNADQKGVEDMGTYRMTQVDFVEFLKTGELKPDSLL